MELETIIFDWSGVISDDFDGVYNTSMKIFEVYRREKISKSEFRRNLSNPPARFWKIYLPHIYIHDIQKHFNKFIVMENYGPMPGALATLDFLKDKLKEMYVLSAHPRHALEAEARRYGIYNYFKAISCDNHYKDRALHRLIEDNRIDVEKTLFVEDMVEGILAGKKAGVKTAALLSGYHSEKKLRTANPDYVFNDVSGLTTLFD